MTEKMKLESMDIAEERREQLKELFPEVFAEDKVDFDQLKRALGEWVEPGKERFGLSWPGKADCMKVIQQPSVATLKPARDESVNFDETENLFIEGDNNEFVHLFVKLPSWFKIDTPIGPHIILTGHSSPTAMKSSILCAKPKARWIIRNARRKKIRKSYAANATSKPLMWIMA